MRKSRRNRKVDDNQIEDVDADSDEDEDDVDDESEEEEDADSEEEDDSDEAESDRLAQERRKFAREKNRGRRAERRKLLSDLGVSSVEEAKQLLGSNKGKSDDSDAGKADEEARALMARAEQRERKAVEREVRARLREALTGAVDSASMEAALRLAVAEVDFDDDELDDDDYAPAIVDAVREMAPALFIDDEDDGEDDSGRKPRTATVKAKRTIRDKRQPDKSTKAQAAKKFADYRSSTRRSNWD